MLFSLGRKEKKRRGKSGAHTISDQAFAFKQYQLLFAPDAPSLQRFGEFKTGIGGAGNVGDVHFLEKQRPS
jgi:hypothetical protein